MGITKTETIILLSLIGLVLTGFQAYIGGKSAGVFSVIPVSFDTSEVIIDQTFSVTSSTPELFIYSFNAPANTDWEIDGVGLSATTSVQSLKVFLDGTLLLETSANQGVSEIRFDSIVGKTVRIEIFGKAGDQKFPDFANVVISGRAIIEEIPQQPQPSPEPVPSPTNPEGSQPVELGFFDNLKLKLGENKFNVFLIVVGGTGLGLLYVFLPRRR